MYFQIRQVTAILPLMNLLQTHLPMFHHSATAVQVFDHRCSHQGPNGEGPALGGRQRVLCENLQENDYGPWNVISFFLNMP